MKIKEKFELIIVVLRISFSGLIKKPLIAFPLAIGAMIKGVALAFLYYYPRKPLSLISAPFLRYYNKEHYLHYPANFVFIAKASTYLNLLLGIVIISFFTGWMTYLVNNYVLDKPLKLKEGFKTALSRYLSLVTVWLVVIMLAMGIFKGQGILLKKYFTVHSSFLKFNVEQINYLLIYVNLFLAALINTFFAFSTPSIVIEKKGFLKSILRSLSLMKTLFFSTYVVVLLPTFLSLPVTLLKYDLSKLMIRFFPEITMLILATAIIAVFIIDSIVLTSVTTLFVLNKETEK